MTMTAKLSYIFGAALLAVGALGFFQDPVLGLFGVNAAHNVVHLATGLALAVLAAAGGRVLTRGLVALGAAYAIVTIAGLLTGEGRVFGLVEVDAADHVLHLLLTVLFFGLALASSGERR